MEACGRILRWWLGAGMEREERSINRTGEREKDNGSCATRSWSMVIGAGRTTPLYSSWHDTLRVSCQLNYLLRSYVCWNER